ncbi:hypothetical protein K1T73_10410 [Roseovarius sp. SCSIO 43702]|uniref:hypothetical protein n=1 Tax=Roseovarius sp. SCSIO 43702 TaxID=2823043 RepID=UPI001C733315|nr:hypothetical protein [Roseovarius sp. SCSIO 43702]QYX55514.1 hypothetical protein K1T73_10410 [Roseovarius sp. SCSIO 43702]
MKEKKPDWVLLVESVDEPLDMRARAERIADVLETGAPSELFLKMLAASIRPSGKPDRFRMELRNKCTGRPKGPDWAVGREMVRIVDDDKKTVDEAVYQVQRKFGVKGNGRSKCLESLRAYREQMEELEWFEGVLKRHGP